MEKDKTEENSKVVAGVSQHQEIKDGKHRKTGTDIGSNYWSTCDYIIICEGLPIE